MGIASFCCSNLEDEMLLQEENDIFDPAFLAANQDVNYPKVIRPTVLTAGLRVKRDRDDHRPSMISDSDDEAEQIISRVNLCASNE